MAPRSRAAGVTTHTRGTLKEDAVRLEQKTHQTHSSSWRPAGRAGRRHTSAGIQLRDRGQRENRRPGNAGSWEAGFTEKITRTAVGKNSRSLKNSINVSKTSTILHQHTSYLDFRLHKKCSTQKGGAQDRGIFTILIRPLHGGHLRYWKTC